MPVTYDSAAIWPPLCARAEAHGHHEEQIGHPDPDWPDWYAQYMVDEQSRTPVRSAPGRAHERLRRHRPGRRLPGRALCGRVGRWRAAGGRRRA